MIKKIITSVTLLAMPLLVKAVKLPNPLQAKDVPELAQNVVQGILGITGAIALFYLVWGGIAWMTSQGNAEKIQRVHI